MRPDPKTVDPNARYQPLNSAARMSVLSRAFILKGCKSGEVPHIKVGSDFRVDYPAWMAKMSREVV